ncbi:response regulator transcription factor [Phenylobacterium sp.]|uniref:response regulator transcription factor n=1 Tax=Phenylobacterium sp. TaxID=1871053 RepID=UPI00286CD98E|nr:response regulator transcription factor [Phenylobacterium sp.]
MAAGALALRWLEFQYLARLLSWRIYVTAIGMAFAAGGVWVGWKLTWRAPSTTFARNTLAQRALGVTGQEMRVLERLAAGQSNKEIARALGLSPNTVKTHLANLFAKLEVARRTQAISKARDLQLIP